MEKNFSRGTMKRRKLWKYGGTHLIPFFVSTYSLHAICPICEIAISMRASSRLAAW